MCEEYTCPTVFRLFGTSWLSSNFYERAPRGDTPALFLTHKFLLWVRRMTALNAESVCVARTRSRHSFCRRHVTQRRVATPAAAIVSTVKDVDQSAVSWCRYHLSVGFEHLYLYFDDPSEHQAMLTTLHAHFSSDVLTLVPHDASLLKEWSALPGVEALLPRAATEVQTRQQLNARHAMALAVSRGLDWLLHIDADELFDPGVSGDPLAISKVCKHFADLEDAGVETFCYVNFEAVPEAHGVTDPFREVSSR